MLLQHPAFPERSVGHAVHVLFAALPLSRWLSSVALSQCSGAPADSPHYLHHAFCLQAALE
jgi:hypothetical protein